MKKVFFRADAGPEIGYGHFMRTLALADMLRDNFDCLFFTQDPSDFQRKELSKVCKYIALPSSHKKFNVFLDYLTGNEIVVLDNYFFDTQYQERIKALGSKLVCIDDMHDKHYVADIVINHGVHDSTLFDVEPYTRLCLGFDWALLRKPFIDATESPIKQNNNSLNSVLITFGGNDEFDNTSSVIKRILNVRPDISITAIIGENYIGKIIPTPNVIYKKNLDAVKMAAEMSDSDLIVCSASTVCIEALACKSRIALDCTVDNQEGIYNYCIDSKIAYPITQLEQILGGKISLGNKTGLVSKDVKKRYCDIFNSL